MLLFRWWAFRQERQRLAFVSQHRSGTRGRRDPVEPRDIASSANPPDKAEAVRYAAGVGTDKELVLQNENG
jgi:hypothetical protein